MITEEQRANLYREMTDSTRSLVGVRHEVPNQNRVKPDPEDNPLALLDYKEFAALGDDAVRLWTEQAPPNPSPTQ